MEEILKRLNAFYACQFNKDGGRFLLSAHGYHPYGDFPANCLRIDGYYPASNSMYVSCREFAKEIGARNTNDLSYKEIALATGEFILGCNQLLIHKKYGSYFVLNIMELKERLDLPVVYFGNAKNFNPKNAEQMCAKCDTNSAVFDTNVSGMNHNNIGCKRCGACEKLCPGGALTEGAFDRDKCLRGMMERPLTMQSIKKLGDCLLGCEVCRACCEYNKGISKAEPPEELLKLTDIQRLLTFDKETGERLAKIIGSNMARGNILIPVAIAAVCKRREWRYIPLIERLLIHGSERVREAAELGLAYYREINGQS